MIRYNKELQEQTVETTQSIPASTEITELKDITMYKSSDQITLSSRIEFIEQKLLKIQSLKESTMDELSSLLNERKGDRWILRCT